MQCLATSTCFGEARGFARCLGVQSPETIGASPEKIAGQAMAEADVVVVRGANVALMV